MCYCVVESRIYKFHKHFNFKDEEEGPHIAVWMHQPEPDCFCKTMLPLITQWESRLSSFCVSTWYWLVGMVVFGSVRVHIIQSWMNIGPFSLESWTALTRCLPVECAVLFLSRFWATWQWYRVLCYGVENSLEPRLGRAQRVILFYCHSKRQSIHREYKWQH